MQVANGCCQDPPEEDDCCPEGQNCCGDYCRDDNIVNVAPCPPSVCCDIQES